MSESYWRDKAAPIIAAVLQEHGPDGPGLAAALREAFPFGPRKHHPYKIWCDEVKRQTHQLPPLGTFTRVPKQKQPAVPNPDQGSLF